MAKLAWRYTTETVELSLPDIHGEDDAEKRMDYLMTVHKIWNYGKVAFKPQLVNGMLSRAYRAFRQGKVLVYFQFIFLSPMAYLHSRTLILVPTRIQIPNPMATFYYVDHVNIAGT